MLTKTSVRTDMENPHLYLMGFAPGSRIPKFVIVTDDQAKEFPDAEPPAQKPDKVRVHVPAGVEVMDRMLTSGRELVLSRRAFETLAELRLPADLVVIPCEWTGPGAQMIQRDYVYCYADSSHEVLDPRFGRAKRVGKHILSVFDWALKWEVIPELDLFQGETGKWFVTDGFVNAVFNHHLTGFGFTRVPVYSSETADPSEE